MKIANAYKKIGLVFTFLALLVVPSHALTGDYEFGELFNGHNSVMLLIDVDSGAIVEANKSAVDYYGYSYDDLVSMRLQGINCLSAEQTKAEMLLAAREERNHFKFKHMLSSGEIRDVEVYSYPFDQDGKKLLYSIIHDVTAKVALEDELEKRNKTLIAWGAAFIAIQTVIIFLLFKSLKENKRIQSELFDSRERYQSLFDNMGEGFALHEIITDEKGRPIDYKYLDVNKAFKDQTGISDACGKTVLEILPGTEPVWIEKYGKVALTGEPIRFESYAEQLGRHFSVVAFSPAKNQFATLFFDITKRVEAERQLESEKEKLKTTLLSVGEGVIVTDAHGKVEYMNKSAETISGKRQEDVRGNHFRDAFKIFSEKDGDKERFPIEDVIATRTAIDWARHACLLIGQGDCLATTISAAPIISGDNVLEGVVVVMRDASEESRRRKEIEFMSYHDFLTNLYNRRFFEEEIVRLDTKRNLPLSIVYADVNGLKIVNDVFGHEKGDVLLIQVADILKKCCREDDIIARVGGDEFAILLPSTSSEMAKGLVGRIRKEIKSVEMETGEMSVALGWGTKVYEGQNLNDVLRLSENHMYKRKVKENGRTRPEIVQYIMNRLYENFSYQKEHSKRVSELCGKIGKALKLPDDEIKRLEMLGVFHDIGMVGVRKEIQDRVGRLTDEEWTEIMRHPVIGRRILMSAGKMADFTDSVMAHHERWDGKGYPNGLVGKEIPFHSRILALADAYVAMTGNRSYRAPMKREEVIEEIKRNIGSQFDPHIAGVFLDYLNQIGTEDI